MPTTLPDIRTDHGRAHLDTHEWPFITGFDILPETANLLEDSSMPSKMTIVCDRASQHLFLPTLAESLQHHHKEITSPQDADLFLFMGGQNTMLAAHRFAMHNPTTPYILLPTTLMAQVSGALGPQNSTGAWHPPLFSLCDIATLSAMGKRHFRSNYAHIARLALSMDEGLFSWLEWWGSKAIGGEISARLVIVRKCAILTQKIALDPSLAPALHLGEDFAIALMQAGHFSESLFPGEALALGIRMAFGLSVRMGYCPTEEAARMRKHLQIAGFQTSLRKSQAPHALHAAEVMAEMNISSRGTPPSGIVLARGIGKVFTTHEIDPDDMAAVIDKVLCE